ncbi:MAG: phosphomannomutase/phosphoglucomutase [Candidatus Hydrogenedentes bacterium]|nr:phosphomannomutase/phosphoglucomutase [Candidatus Hydrogenedentota bacterium]
MNPDIFREYDIRGVAGKDLTAKVAEQIGKAYGTMAVKKRVSKVAVGRDCRLSGPRLVAALIKGIRSTGVDVIELGMVPTPVVYFSLFTLPIGGAIQVTGSHNPPEYNGFKICFNKTTIHGKDIQQIRQIIETGKFQKGKGSVEKYDIVPEYKAYLKDNIHLERSVKVVLDAGNGAGGWIAAPLFRSLGCKVKAMYCKPDGRFPHHMADPTVEKNLDDLIKAVKKEKAELGIAYDGDADRIGVVDNRGKIIWGDMLLVLFARDILRDHPGAKIIGEVKCSDNLYDDIAKHGGEPIMWKTGHSLIKAKMKTSKALIAGEMSGHMFFADRYFGYDDAIYASLRLVEFLSRSRKRISSHLSDIPKTYATPEIRVPVADDKVKFSIVQKAKRRFAKEFDVSTVDGVRIRFPEGWGLVRASNTQPILVTRYEATSRKALREIQRFVETEIAKFNK